MATSASNLLDATISPSIADEPGEGCPVSLLPSTMEKRKHTETGDGSPQSQRLPSAEKRSRVEHVEQPPQSLPPTEEQKPCKCIGKGANMTFDKLPPKAQESYLKVKKRFGALWDKLGMENHRASDIIIGDLGDIDPGPYPGQYSDPKQISLVSGSISAPCVT